MSIAIITGCVGDIARATADLLGAQGWTLILTDIDDERGKALAATLQDKGIDAAYRHCDVTSTEDWRRLAKKVDALHDRLDLLYFNAGSSSRTPIGLTEIDDWTRMLDLHVTSAYRGVQACLRLLRRGRGSVVLTSSIHARAGFGGYSAYAAAKGGLEALARQLAVDCAPEVRVNAVGLGSIHTAPWNTTSPRELTAIQRRIPLRRIGLPEDVAPAVAFLASAGAAYITGQTIVIDGGRTSWSGE